MSEGQSILQSWESVISDFFLQKRNLEEEQYIKEVLKNFYSNDHSLMKHFEDEKLKMNKDEEPIDFQRRRIQGFFRIINGLSANDKEVFDAISSLINEY